MFSTLSLPFRWGRSVFKISSRAIEIPSVDIHNVENGPEKRALTLKHLLKANHANYSIIYHNLQFDNHTPHILGSAYLLGATSEQLNTVYESETQGLDRWKASPGEITIDDWRDYLGKREYQRAYVDFFEDQFVANGYDWKKLLEQFFFEGSEPLIHSLTGGVGHSLIHLGYAYELSSRTIAIESLAMAACFYSDLHKYLDEPAYTKPASYSSSSVMEMLDKVAKDPQFDKLFKRPGFSNMDELLAKREDAVMDHWNAWKLSEDPTELFAESQKAATAVLVATHGKAQYDFFLVHLLTTSHAVRILLPIVPAEFQIALVRQWWLLTLVTYIAQTRPKISMERIEDFPLKGRTWKYVEYQALTSKHAQDAHYVKGLRAMKNAAETWGDESGFYLKAAVKFASEFDGWGGFY